jgi:hypothetical protein
MSSIQNMWWRGLGPEVLGQPYPNGPAICSPHGLPFGLASHIACGFLWTFLTSWGLSTLSLAFTLTVSCIALARVACRDLDSDTHCLASKALLWNLSGSLYDLITLPFCIPEKPASYGQCQGLLSTQAVSRPLWTTVVVPSKCLSDWTLKPRGHSSKWPCVAKEP